MTTVLFTIGATVAAVLLGPLVLTLLVRPLRIWPTPGSGSWQGPGSCTGTPAEGQRADCGSAQIESKARRKQSTSSEVTMDLTHDDAQSILKFIDAAEVA